MLATYLSGSLAFAFASYVIASFTSLWIKNHVQSALYFFLVLFTVTSLPVFSFVTVVHIALSIYVGASRAVQ